MKRIVSYITIITMVVLFISCSHNKYSDDDISASDSIKILLQDYHKKIDTFPDSAFKSADSALRLLQRGGNRQTKFDVFFALGVASEKSGQYDIGIKYFKEALENSKNINPSRLDSVYNYIGQSAFRLGENDKAMVYFSEALKRRSQDDLEGQASSYRNIGAVYQSEEFFMEAETNYLKSLQLYEQLDNIEGQADCYKSLGSLYHDEKDYDEALEYYLKSEQYYEKINSSELLLEVIYNRGLLKEDALEDDEQARYEYLRALNIAQAQSNHRVMAEAYNSLGRVMYRLGKADSAICYCNKAIETAQLSNLKEIRSQALAQRAEAYCQLRHYTESKEDFKDAIYVLKQLDTIGRNRARSFTQAHMEYEEGIRQEQQLKLNRTLQNYIATLACAVLLAVVIIVILYRNNVQRKKTNAILSNQRDEIKSQRDEITESINAASLVQKAVLPHREYMEQILPNHFIFNMPYNSPHISVSGDFYWMLKKGRYTIVTVADCTGHGTCGAIVSMLGISSLIEIANDLEIPKSDVILNRLRDMIILLLNPEGAEWNTLNGMDMALIVINELSHEIEFSGAKNPLYWIHNGELREKKANPMPIGADERQHLPFTSEIFTYAPGDMIYLFSDGYVDQFDSEDKERFKKKRFKNLLLSISGKPLHEQSRILEKVHRDWRGAINQTDDILVMGIKF